eukprot:713343-Prymnesium_polylepis.1
MLPSREMRSRDPAQTRARACGPSRIDNRAVELRALTWTTVVQPNQLMRLVSLAVGPFIYILCVVCVVNEGRIGGRRGTIRKCVT